MKDRIAKASAEADRKAEYASEYTPASATRYCGFMDGVEWADANPKRMKVSASDFDRVVAMRPYSLLAALDQLGIEVEDNENDVLD